MLLSFVDGTLARLGRTTNPASSTCSVEGTGVIDEAMVSYAGYLSVIRWQLRRLKNYVVQVWQQVPKPGLQGLSKAYNPNSRAVSPYEPTIRLGLAQQKDGLACVAQGLELGLAHH